MSDSRAHISTAMNKNLVLNLQLEAKGKEVKIVSGHIERFNLILQPYGYHCRIQFSAYGDEVDPIFNAEEVAKATLSFKNVDPASYEEKGPPLLELKGIVTEKCFTRLSHSTGDKKPFRLYEVTILDNARAAWEQHFPISMYVDQSMKEIIEKHVNPEITIKFDWDKLEVKNPVTAFSLPHRDWLPDDQQVSFYSFLSWYLHQENGVFTYDYKTHSYTVTGKKAKAEGKPFEILEWWIDPPICSMPQTPLFNSRKRKHNFDSVENEDKENKNAFKEVRRESFTEENYRCFPEQAYEVVQSDLTPTKNVVECEFIKMDDQIPFDKMVPGSPVSFKGITEGSWSSDAGYKGKTFIIRSLYIHSEKLSRTEELAKPVQSFRLQVKATLEEPEETHVLRPAFIPPVFPFAIQGKIFSDVGDKEQTTYKILENEKAPLGQYEVEIPLIEDGKKCVIPFTPDLISGQFYYPFTKGQRVELSVYFHTAKILRLSDWQPLTRLPQGTQGCQTVFATNGQDKYTIMRHEFEDGKNAVFTIKQSSSETKSQTMVIKEDLISIIADEKDKTTLSFLMDLAKNFSISFEDKSSKTTQQVVFDGTALTLTSKGSGGTSVFTLKPDEIGIQTTNLVIKADDVAYDVKNVICLTAKNKVELNTKIVEAPANALNLG